MINWTVPINFRFVRSQLKNLIIPLIIFFIILLILLIPALTQTSFAAGTRIHKTATSGSGTGLIGAGVILNYVYFGIPGLIVIIAFSIILIHIVLTKEIDCGYFSSWLVTPMSRRTILNSKLFSLLSGILIVYFAAFLVQVIFFPIIIKEDFSLFVFGNIMLYNFALILLVVLWTSINWFIMCSFNKAAKAVSIASVVSTFFVVCSVLSMLGSAIPSLKVLEYFKYLTITSLLNSPFSFGSTPGFESIPLPPGVTEISKTVTAPIFGPKAKDFAWQLPVMFLLSFGFFALGEFIFSKRDLQL